MFQVQLTLLYQILSPSCVYFVLHSHSFLSIIWHCICSDVCCIPYLICNNIVKTCCTLYCFAKHCSTSAIIPLEGIGCSKTLSMPLLTSSVHCSHIKVGILHKQLDHMTYIDPSAAWPIPAAQWKELWFLALGNDAHSHSLHFPSFRVSKFYFLDLK